MLVSGFLMLTILMNISRLTCPQYNQLLALVIWRFIRTLCQAINLWKGSRNCCIRFNVKDEILLCGDIHPCPGPSESCCSYRSGYKCFEKKGLHFIHLNVRSLLPKLDELRILARETKPACFCITETWLDDTVSDSENQIENYNVRRRDRNRRGGGVCVYVRSDLAFNPLDELYHDELEATWIELILPKIKPIVLDAVYRPPQQTVFYDVFEAVCLNNSLFYERECFVLGDFNTNVTGSKRCNLVKNLNSCLDLLNLSQKITDYTRVSSMSSTTIDLVLVSDKEKVSQSGAIDIGISDHCLVYCTRKVTKNTFNKNNTVKVRSMKNYNPETFQTNLLNTDWHQVMISDNVTEAWENFKKYFCLL